MRDFPASSPAVVVGIDGSPTAVDAALWAVDEAVSRDIPLRLVYAIGGGGGREGGGGGGGRGRGGLKGVGAWGRRGVGVEEGIR